MWCWEILPGRDQISNPKSTNLPCCNHPKQKDDLTTTATKPKLGTFFRLRSLGQIPRVEGGGKFVHNCRATDHRHAPVASPSAIEANTN